MEKVKLDTKGLDLILGGLVYSPDAEGFVEVPRSQAIAEGHIKVTEAPPGLPAGPLVPGGNQPPAPWEQKP